MKPCRLPSGRVSGIPFILPHDWTPEQALAVVELLDDLREIIWAHYEIPLHELIRELNIPVRNADEPATKTPEPPF